MIVAVAALVGLAMGSFVTVLIERVPQGEQWWAGRSRCDSCHREIAARDNVPVVSWLLLRGGCRHCGARIGARYPLIEVATSAAFVAVALWVGPRPLAILLALMVVITLALAVIDLEHLRLPNALVYLSYPVAIAGLVADAATEGPWASLGRAAAGAGVALALYGGLWLVYPRGLGFGDVKFAPALGIIAAYLGWAELVVGLFAAPLLGLMWALVARRGGESLAKMRIPYGPAMIAGWWIGLMVGPNLADIYLRVVGLGP